MSRGGSGNEITLAAVMEAGGSGNKDEFIYLSIDSRNEKDYLGREFGRYLMSTKGYKLFSIFHFEYLFKESNILEVELLQEKHTDGVIFVSLSSTLRLATT